jgi:hypothetical protein
MTRTLDVSRNDDGQFEVLDERGKTVEGPFDTNAAAWSALDRIDQDTMPGKRRCNKKVLWGKPEKPAKRNGKKASRRQAAKDLQRMNANAANAPGWVRSVAAAKFDPVGERNYRDHRLGTFGAASEVRRIDPAAYLAEKAANEAIRAVNNVECGSSR